MKLIMKIHECPQIFIVGNSCKSVSSPADMSVLDLPGEPVRGTNIELLTNQYGKKSADIIIGTALVSIKGQ